MKYKDLRDFIEQLESQGELKRITAEIDPNLEMTEICDRTLRAGGPALLFENPKGFDVPVLGNLFGTPERVAMGMGEDSVVALREVGKLLASLKEPSPPKDWMDDDKPDSGTAASPQDGESKDSGPIGGPASEH